MFDVVRPRKKLQIAPELGSYVATGVSDVVSTSVMNAGGVHVTPFALIFCENLIRLVVESERIRVNKIDVSKIWKAGRFERRVQTNQPKTANMWSGRKNGN